MTDNPRYERLFTYDPTDYKSWAHGLKKCGYATDKRYAHKLINTIKKYKLHEFDLMLEEQPAIVASENAPKLEMIIAQNFPTNPPPNPAPSSMPAPEAFVLPNDYKRGDGLRKFASKGNKILEDSSSILWNKK